MTGPQSLHHQGLGSQSEPHLPCASQEDPPRPVGPHYVVPIGDQKNFAFWSTRNPKAVHNPLLVFNKLISNNGGCLAGITGFGFLVDQKAKFFWSPIGTT